MARRRPGCTGGPGDPAQRTAPVRKAAATASSLRCWRSLRSCRIAGRALRLGSGPIIPARGAPLRKQRPPPRRNQQPLSPCHRPRKCQSDASAGRRVPAGSPLRPTVCPAGSGRASHFMLRSIQSWTCFTSRMPCPLAGIADHHDRDAHVLQGDVVLLRLRDGHVVVVLAVAPAWSES